MLLTITSTTRPATDLGVRPDEASVLPHDAVGASSDDPLVRWAKTEKSERDVKVAVGPDGELLRLGTGRHRTARCQWLSTGR